MVWNCGDEECGIGNVLGDCCVMSDVENDAICCDQMWWCDVKSRCGVKCAAMLNVGVV